MSKEATTTKSTAIKPKKAAGVKYIGPTGPVVSIPNLNIKFRPAALKTDQEIKDFLQLHPGLAIYFQGLKKPIESK
ncbi:MAG: hypothetical protein AAFU67_04045 [Bacteroidota bacterium]